MISLITSLAAHPATAGSFPTSALLFIINQSVYLDQIDHVNPNPEKVIP